MADIDDNDVTYQDASPATPPKGFVVKTRVSSGAHIQAVDVSTSALPTGAATAAAQTDGSQKTKLTDGAGVVNTKQVGTAITGADVGLVTNGSIHGLSTSGGGTYVDVKVSPSGAVQVGGTLDGITNAVPVTDNAGSLTVDGAVSVSNFPATYPVTDNSGSLTVDNTSSTPLYITPTDDVYHDAFARLRVAEVGNRFDVELTNDLQPLLMDVVTVTGATVTHNSTTRDATLAIANTTTNTSAVFCSHYNAPYTPGCSQLIDITGTLDLANIGGGTASIVIKNNGNETSYSQANWTGAANASSVLWKYSQIFAVDFQSLKVGRVRCYLVRNGIPLKIHEILNDNIRANGYWQHPNHRLYWRIYNTADNTIAEMGYGSATNGICLRYTFANKNASATMLAICGTVKSEGGKDLFDMSGYQFGYSNRVTAKTVSNTLIPILSIQVQPTFNSLNNRSVVIPQNISLSVDNLINYRILLNPTLTGASFASVDTNSSVYYDVTASAVSGGTLLDDDFAASGSARAAIVKSLAGRVAMSANWGATTGDILTIAGIRATVNNASTLASIRWIEIR